MNGEPLLGLSFGEAFVLLFSTGALTTSLIAYAVLAIAIRHTKGFRGVLALLIVATVTTVLDTAFRVAGGLMQSVEIALQINRLFEIVASGFLIAIPAFFASILGVSWQRRVADAVARSMVVIVAAMLVVAFAWPELFVSVTNVGSAIGRGVEGPIFKVRDALFVATIAFAFIISVRGYRLGSFEENDAIIVAGVSIGLLFGLAALYSNFTGFYPGPLTDVRFSRVSAALTVFTLAATISHIRRFVLQSKELDAVNRNLRASRDALAAIAYLDSVTNLPNLQAFARDLREAPRDGVRGALMIIDLKDFKGIVDSYGFETGQRILTEAGRRLVAVGTARFGEAVRTYRVANDRFAVWIREGTRPHLAELADGILAAIARPFVFGDDRLYIGASGGACTWDATLANPDADADEIVRRARRALADARRQPNTVVWFDPAQHGSTEDDQRLTQALRRGIADGDFRLVYQPIVDASRRTVAAEALLRWDVAPPDLFVPLAERAGLIVPLTQNVMRLAEHDIPQLRARHPDLSIHFNVSARHVEHLDLLEALVGMTRRLGIPNEAIGIELTESSFLHAVEYTGALLSRIGDAGFGVAIDDFGTGYASFSSFKQIPADVVKIDKSFVADLAGSSTDRALVEAVVGLALRLGKRVVAEGVENAAQANAALNHGVTYLQGFHFGRPVAPSAFT